MDKSTAQLQASASHQFGELSQTSYERQPATERQRLAEELRGLQLLVEQGAVLYGKRLEKVVPNGSAYSCYGRPSAISSGGCSNLGPDLMA